MAFSELIRNFVAWSVVCFWGSCFGCYARIEAGDVRAALENQGFSNVRVAQRDSLTLVTIQNDAYKLQASGIAAATRTLEQEGLPGNEVVKLIVLDYDVPQVTLTYNPMVGDWKASHHLDKEDWKLARTAVKTGSSFGKVDVVVYPQVSLMNLIITQVYQSLWQLSPALEMTLWPGSKLSCQLQIPVYNDGYGARESKVHPGMITL